MRNVMTALALAAMTTIVAAPAFAEDPVKPADADAAEEAFLKAYFKERELKQIAVAETEYAAVIERHPASREVVARSLLGRARCLKFMKRDAEVQPLLARISAEFGDFKDVVAEASRMSAASAGTKATSLAEAIDQGLRSEEWSQSGGKWVWQNGVVQLGEQAVPHLAKYLRSDEPEMVCRATWDLLAIDTPSAIRAVLDAALDPKLAFPSQLARGVGVPPLQPDEGFLRAALESPHQEIRTACAVRAYDVNDHPGEWVYEAIVRDPAAVRSILVKRRIDPSMRLGVLLVKAGASGPGSARDAALAACERIDFSFPSNPWLAPFLDPPAAFLADREVMRAVWKGLEHPRGPASPALMQALFDDPETEDVALKLCFHEGDISMVRPDQFVDVLARHGFGGTVTNVNEDGQDEDISVLMKLLGSPPTAERLRRVASVFPAEGDWFPFLDAVHAATNGGQSEITALFDATPHAELKSHVLEWFKDREKALGPWIVRLIVLGLDSSDERVVNSALAALDRARASAGFDITPHAAAIAELIGKPREAAAIDALSRMGAPAAPELRSRLVPGRSWTVAVVNALGALRDAESVPGIEEILATSANASEVHAAAGALVSIRGDDAMAKLMEAIERERGRFTRDLLLAVATRRQRLTDQRLGEIFVHAIAKAPGRIGWYPPDLVSNDLVNQHVSQFPTAVLRRIALAALSSTAFEDRRWGAAHELELLDPEAWDALLAAAKDLNAYVRGKALAALAKIRDNEAQLARLKALGDDRATRARVRELLASQDTQSRLAGIAAVVATHDDTSIPELIRIAAEDKDTNVARAAREALLAFGRPAQPAAEGAK